MKINSNVPFFLWGNVNKIFFVVVLFLPTISACVSQSEIEVGVLDVPKETFPVIEERPPIRKEMLRKKSKKQKDIVIKVAKTPPVLMPKSNPKMAELLNVDFGAFRRGLYGLDTEALIARLGTPALKRREPPAQIWQYKTTKCVVLFFLYPNNKDVRVDNIQVLRRDKGPINEKACFLKIVNNKK